MTEGSAARPTWQTPVLWTAAVVAALFLLAALTGAGLGMFGWGFMMGLMWIWMLVPVLLIVLVVVLLTRAQEAKH